MGIDDPKSLFTNDAFISYSRKDREFAARLEKALRNYKPPKGLSLPQRNLVVFRDEEDFTGTEYHASLEKHLKNSRKMVVICSPQARKSDFVNDEIRLFAKERGKENIIPVLVSGIPNNEAKPDQAEEKAFPEALCKLMEMPLAASYIGFDPKKGKVNKGVYYGPWYKTLADIYDLSRNEIEERDRKRRRNAWITAAAVVILIFAVISSLAIYAWNKKLEADTARKKEAEQRVVAEKERDDKEIARKGEEEQRKNAEASAEETRKQRDIAREQRDLAEKRMRIAEARRLAAQSQVTLESFPQRSLLLGLEALATTRRAGEPRVPIAEEVLRQGLVKMGGRGLSGHEGPVNAVAISPDNRWLLTGSDDKTARLWDLRAKDPAGASIVLRGHESSIYAVAISPDNRWLVTGSGDNTARLWDLRIDELVELACRTTGRNLNEEEWKRYMGNLPYQKTCSKISIHPSLIEAARDAARRGEIKTAVAQFKTILEIEPNLALIPQEEAKKMYATALLGEGESLAGKGKIKEAIANYKKARQIDPTLNIDFESWALLCWRGALTGFAKEVMGACERAVALAPEDNKGGRDSRGLARALTGDYPGAIEDFKAVVEWLKKDPRYEDYRRKRESWIAALEAGKNPFDQATLEALRKE